MALPNCFEPPYQSEGYNCKCTAFHMKGCATSLALIGRYKTSRKWPIEIGIIQCSYQVKKYVCKLSPVFTFSRLFATDSKDGEEEDEGLDHQDNRG